ncbi:MAG: ADP-glyceromanno-heptose 6-epimerase [Candidatus Velthaea sp.]
MNGTRRGRTVVTGGAGLIGSALVWQLNRDGIDDAIVVDRLGTSEKWRHLVPLRFSDYVEADSFYERIARDPEAYGRIATVYHLGACSATTERDAAYLIRNNVALSQDVARWAVARDARFVYASSAATYGALERDLREDRDPHTLRPLNMYGYSKQLFDVWARREGVLARAAGLKFFNVFGPNEDHKGDMRSVVAKAFEQIAETGTLRLFRSHRAGIADGEQTRDFLYVKDAVAMTAHLGRTRSANGIFNIGAGAARTWNELARAIFAALDRPPAIEYIPMPEQLRTKYQYRTEAVIDRLRGAGYGARITPLEDAVADYVRNYLLTSATLGSAASESPLPTLSATR